MVKFADNFTSWLLMGLLVVSMIGFVVSIQIANGVTDNLLTDPVINKTFVDLTDTLESSSATANSSKSSFEDDQPDKGFGSLIIFAILGVGQTITSMVLGVYNILFVLPAVKLGIPKVVLNVFSSILLVSLILGAWRVYRAGD